ncbi:MarR family winged helix-turn-helix transcriptional regulator [Paenarthrobacter ureafaciens]|uniref:MarR family winged helix-turn-helix transcriptional regulator n=1 Tax=Paenarthrobacter ureafaciens TaxID=37931 RepID=UPI002DBE888B|nr:MarR family transcriptional regulator [Paenarthrobacter ureafaciens]MEC3853904.1 MarR family transcriptional regulator [Paenarthrobacter ureafaciens]
MGEDADMRSHPLVKAEAVSAAVIEPRGSIGFLIRCAQQIHTRYWTWEFDGILTGPQYAVLAAVGRWPGIDQRRAGELASLDKSSAADVVGRLADFGWLARDSDAVDQRKRVLRLTPPARAALRGITPRVQHVQQRLTSNLSEGNAAEFISLLARVAYRSPSDLDVEPAEVDADVIGISTAPGHLLRRAQQVHTALWGTLVGEELTGPQYAVVATLVRHGEMNQKQLGESASLDKSVVADVVQRLHHKGLLVKDRDPADARRRLLRMTVAGNELLDKVTPGVAQVQEALLDPLSPDEAEKLLYMLRKVCQEPGSAGFSPAAS